MIANPSFESGVTGFYTDYTLGVFNNVVSSNGVFVIADGNSNSWATHWGSAACSGISDQQGATRKFLAYDAWSDINWSVWQANTTGPVIAGVTYRFSLWVIPIGTGASAKPYLEVRLPGDSAWTNFSSNALPLPSPCTTSWYYRYVDFTAPRSASHAMLRLRNLEGSLNGNAFALDDLFFGRLTDDPIINGGAFNANFRLYVPFPEINSLSTVTATSVGHYTGQSADLALSDYASCSTGFAWTSTSGGVSTSAVTGYLGPGIPPSNAATTTTIRGEVFQGVWIQFAMPAPRNFVAVRLGWSRDTYRNLVDFVILGSDTGNAGSWEVASHHYAIHSCRATLVCKEIDIARNITGPLKAYSVYRVVVLRSCGADWVSLNKLALLENRCPEGYVVDSTFRRCLPCSAPYQPTDLTRTACTLPSAPLNNIFNGDLELGLVGWRSEYDFLHDWRQQYFSSFKMGVINVGTSSFDYSPYNWWSMGCSVQADHSVGTTLGRYFIADGSAVVGFMQPTDFMHVLPNEIYRFQVFWRSLSLVGPANYGVGVGNFVTPLPRLEVREDTNSSWTVVAASPGFPDPSPCLGWQFLYADIQFNRSVALQVRVANGQPSPHGLGNDIGLDSLWFGLVADAPHTPTGLEPRAVFAAHVSPVSSNLFAPTGPWFLLSGIRAFGYVLQADTTCALRAFVKFRAFIDAAQTNVTSADELMLRVYLVNASNAPVVLLSELAGFPTITTDTGNRTVLELQSSDLRVIRGEHWVQDSLAHASPSPSRSVPLPQRPTS